MDEPRQRLRMMIISGELSPGEQIRQQEMADLFGISRVPLREAMNVLADQGLLLHRPNQGYFVTKRAPGELAQIRRMLHLLENELVPTLAWPTQEVLERLTQLNEEMAEYVHRPDWAPLPKLNREFHFCIFDLSPDRLILEEVERLWTQADPFILVKFESAKTRAKTVEEHFHIIQAFKARDREALIQAMNQHRASNSQDLSEMLGTLANDPHGLIL